MQATSHVRRRNFNGSPIRSVVDYQERSDYLALHWQSPLQESYERLQLRIIGDTDERLQRDNLHQIGVNEVLCEFAGREVVTERPAITAQDEICAGALSGPHSIGQAH